MKKILLISFIIISLSSFSQQTIKIKIDQPGIEKCLGTNTVISEIPKYTKVYPNPAKNKLYIEIADYPSDQSLEILLVNLVGQRVIHQKDVVLRNAMTYSLDIEKLPAGIYNVVIIENKLIYSEKITVLKN
ncbi:MAG: T9SS type A sorting domain-containing protein [Draconibacterium sp.]